MDNLKLGVSIDINKPRGEQKYYDKTVNKFVIFGDETTLALICSFCPVLKREKHDFQFYLELEEENINLPKLLGLENCTVFPKNGSFRNEEWVSELPVFQLHDLRSTNFVLTGNVKSVQTFRKALRKKNTGKIVAQGYWLEGKKGL